VSHIRCYFVRRQANGEEVEVREEELHLRSFFPQELDLLVRSQEFEVVEKFGNFERKAFGSGDPKQVMVCRLLGAVRHQRDGSTEAKADVEAMQTKMQVLRCAQNDNFVQKVERTSGRHGSYVSLTGPTT
jgi:hypothetical protein